MSRPPSPGDRPWESDRYADRIDAIRVPWWVSLIFFAAVAGLSIYFLW